MKTILLVEDEQIVRQLERRILEKQGYAVLEAEEPADAVRLGREHPGPLHLLVTDVVMPGMDGWQLAGIVGISHPEMKVLYVSGYTGHLVARHDVVGPEASYLPKPFTPKALVCKVREVLAGL